MNTPETKKRRVAILTGGGDAPGLNGIIEATSRVLLQAGVEVVGIQDGFEGIFEERTRLVTLENIEGLHAQAGTYLGTSNKSNVAGREKEFLEKFGKLKCEGLIVAGGDGTFSLLSRFGSALKILGVPKTIDNDLQGTEITFGYDTAVSIVAEAADALKATAEAHRRVMVVEAMGRTAGWIALGGGLAGYADAILIPERPYSREKFLEFIRARKQRGQRGLIVVASEGAAAEKESAHVAFRVENAPQAERYGGIAMSLARWIEAETGWESRPVVLGHLQRSAHPTTTDRFLTLAMGVETASMMLDGVWGMAAVYRNGRVQRAPISELMGGARVIPADHRWIKLAQALGTFI